MPRLLSAVVLASVGTLSSLHASAQPAPPTTTARPRPPPATATSPGSAGFVAGNEPSQKKPDDRLSDEAELARAVGLYEAGKYNECSSELERLLDPTGRAPLRQVGIVEKARVYWAACLLGAGAGDAADAPLRAAIHENPQMKAPDSLVFPQPVVQRFLKVRDSLVNEIRAAEEARIKQAQAEAKRREQNMASERARMTALEQLASQETRVIQNRRVLSFVPFGVGQIQNRQEALGYTLMASEVLLASLSIAAVAVQSRLAAQADETIEAGNTVLVANYEATQRTWSNIKLVSFWSFAALAVGGVLHAQLEFVPEFRETRPRKLPPGLAPARKTSEISAAPFAFENGGGLSVSGRF